MDIETLAIDLHEAGRDAVLKGKTLAPNVNKDQHFTEWADLPEHAKEGRRIQARWLLQHYTMQKL